MPSHLDTAMLSRRMCFISSLWMRFPRVMPPSGSHDVTHPIRERRSPGSAGSVEQHALADPESAAEALDGGGPG
jgi:hypothetical protein